MVIKDKDTKNLVVPASLGNFGNAGGGEGGITPEEAAEIASAITENALDEYDTELQVDLEDMREAISANTQSIEDLSGATGDISAISAQTDENTQAISAISQDIEDLSGATGSISSGLDTLSGVCEGISSAVSANTDNITALSAQTSANTEAIEALSGVSVDIATLSAQTSANTANIEALSAATSALSITVETISGRTREKVLVDVYAVDNMSYADRTVLWDEIYAKVLEGADVYATGEVQNTTQRAIVPLSQYVAETEPSTHIGGFLYFTSKAYGDNLEIQFSFSSGGNLTGLSGSSKFNRRSGYELPTATATIKGGVKVGSGLTIDSEKLSVKIGDGLGFSGDTLVVSGGTGGGGIEKVSSLPATAEEGDFVYLVGEVRTGYTILCVENDGYAGWVWELDMNFLNVDGSPITFRYGDVNIGQWFANSSDIIVRTRIASNNVYLDVIDEGGHTIEVGANAVSITSGVDFPFKGCLYEYRGGKWYQKPNFEWVYNQSEALDLLDRLRGGIEDFGLDNFVVRYAPDGAVKREFKVYHSAYYGLDMQATDDRRTYDWGRVSIVNYRLGNDGSIADMVGEHWILCDAYMPSIPQMTFVKFGNPEKGGLTYDKDNDCFYFDSQTISTGDTTTVYEDLVDNLLTDGLVDGELVNDVLVCQNNFKLSVIFSGETTDYSHPIVSRKVLSTPVSIDGRDFYKILRLYYGTWVEESVYFKPFYISMYYGADDGNNAACLRYVSNT